MYCISGKECLTQREAGSIINSAKRFAHYNHQKDIPRRYYLCDICAVLSYNSQKVQQQTVNIFYEFCCNRI
jgi:hypothetical protein